MAHVLRVDRLYLTDDGRDNAATLNRVLDAAAAWFNVHQDQADPMAGFVWPPPSHRLTGTNQDAINLFARAAGANYVDWLRRAGLLEQVTARRSAPYAGPSLEEMPGLTRAEQAALIAALPK